MKLAVVALVPFLLFGLPAQSADWPLNDLTIADIDAIADIVLKEHSSELSTLGAPLERHFNFEDYIPTPLISSAELKIVERWDYAVSSFKPVLILTLAGTYTRYKGMSKDGVALILCHELGHAIGGAPTFKTIHPTLGKALSAEGQADYFAASSCFSRYARKVPAENSTKESNPIVSKLCSEANSSSSSDREICERAAMAGETTLLVLNSIRKMTGKQVWSFSFGTPSRWDQASTGEESQLDHPEAQCRLDTYVAGALCGDKKDCESESLSRPKCWYVKK